MEFRENIRLGMKEPLSPPLMNGGGCCKTVEHVKELSRSTVGAIVAGSYTMDERSGNAGDVWWVEDDTGLNSLGMPNGGRNYLASNLPEMVTIAHDAGKALIVNVAGFSPEEYAILTEVAFEHGADAVEENLGCPNVLKDGGRKPIASFNLEVMEEIIWRIEARGGRKAAITFKLSPYSDPELLRSAAILLMRYEAPKAVTVTNTFPSAFGFNKKGQSAISVGLAGLSGRALKHIGLGQVKQWNDVLQGKKDIIAVGGIRRGQDIRDYSALGAVAFQMTTEILKPGFIDLTPLQRVAIEYLNIEE